MNRRSRSRQRRSVTPGPRPLMVTPVPAPRRLSLSRPRSRSATTIPTSAKAPTRVQRAQNLTTDFLASLTTLLKDPTVSVLIAVSALLIVGHLDKSADSLLTKAIKSLATSIPAAKPFTDWLLSHDHQLVGLLVVLPMAFTTVNRKDSSPFAAAATAGVFVIVYSPQPFWFYFVMSILMRAWLTMVSYQHRMVAMAAFVVLVIIAYSNPVTPSSTAPGNSTGRNSRSSLDDDDTGGCASVSEIQDLTQTISTLRAQLQDSQSNERQHRSRYDSLDTARKLCLEDAKSLRTNFQTVADSWRKWYKDHKTAIDQARPPDSLRNL